MLACRLFAARWVLARDSAQDARAATNARSRERQYARTLDAVYGHAWKRSARSTHEAEAGAGTEAARAPPAAVAHASKPATEICDKTQRGREIAMGTSTSAAKEVTGGG